MEEEYNEFIGLISEEIKKKKFEKKLDKWAIVISVFAILLAIYLIIELIWK